MYLFSNPAIMLLGVYRDKENTCPKRDSCHTVPDYFIHNSSYLGTTRISIRRRTGEYVKGVLLNKAILVRSKKKRPPMNAIKSETL